jgi:hypothetical protein
MPRPFKTATVRVKDPILISPKYGEMRMGQPATFSMGHPLHLGVAVKSTDKLDPASNDQHQTTCERDQR